MHRIALCLLVLMLAGCISEPEPAVTPQEPIAPSDAVPVASAVWSETLQDFTGGGSGPQPEGQVPPGLDFPVEARSFVVEMRCGELDAVVGDPPRMRYQALGTTGESQIERAGMGGGACGHARIVVKDDPLTAWDSVTLFPHFNDVVVDATIEISFAVSLFAAASPPEGYALL